jgi:hypothetical protein
MYKYQPKRPVKSFQDLDVYQQTHNLAIKIAKHPQLAPTALEIPKLIAIAHSVRFGDPDRAIANLEQAMINCNLMVVYLDQYRDLHHPSPVGAGLVPALPGDTINQIQKDYLAVRRKILNLQRSWQKFIGINKLNQNATR